MHSGGPRLTRPVTFLLAALAVWGGGSVLARVAGSDTLVGTLFHPWTSISVAAVAALVVLSRYRGGRAEQPWAFLGAGLLLWQIADALTLASDATGLAAADAFRLTYLTSVLLVAGGLLGVMRGRGPAIAGLRLDALTTGLAAGAFVAWVALDPVGEVITAGATTLATGVNGVLFIAEALLVVITVCGFVLLRWRPDGAWLLATCATVSFLVAESGFILSASAGTWSPMTATNAGWSGAAVLFALAARWPARDVRPAEHGTRLADVLVPLGFALGSVTLLALGGPLGVGPIPTVLAAASLVTALARLTLTALEHARMLEESQVEARTDALTGLGNRRRFTADLDALLAGGPADTALVLFDLDGFKAFNDRHGHPAGDALLVALGGELAAHVGVDHAYRLGGDEFCALVEAPGGSLRLAVDNAAAALRGAAERAGLGASHGAAYLGDEGPTRPAAVRIADQRLYADKARRRLQAA